MRAAGPPGAALPEFSYRTREFALRSFREDTFDLLVVGGGITGAAVARDAASRGLKVALVERGDFAQGTSSRSSKLIHGGLRYLRGMEFGLVFEALRERALLLRTSPHLIRPLRFLLPVYKGDPDGMAKLGLGLWLYDLLALFRTPRFHRRLSAAQLRERAPTLRTEGLLGGYEYADASMWDDVLVVHTLRSAHALGASVANYVEATGPLWTGDRITGMRIRDVSGLPMPGQPTGDAGVGEFDLRARRVIICAGPWTDLVGRRISPQWRDWLKPSKGVHLVFSADRFPLQGAVVMSQPEDGRIVFAIPRTDFGPGVTIVGTTDGPSEPEPEKVVVTPEDVRYLLGLLARYFPDAALGEADILSAYVGVRPLFGATVPGNARATAGGGGGAPEVLQKVSREHHIAGGPGGTVVVAGGKYTTHRSMAREIVDFTLQEWKRDLACGASAWPPSIEGGIQRVAPSATLSPVFPPALRPAVEASRIEAAQRGLDVPPALFERYGAEALRVAELRLLPGPRGEAVVAPAVEDPPGFPLLGAQLRHAMRTEMVLHLEDFVIRRVPLALARQDAGQPWWEALARVWADERGLGHDQAFREVRRLAEEQGRRQAWRASPPAVSAP